MLASSLECTEHHCPSLSPPLRHFPASHPQIPEDAVPQLWSCPLWYSSAKQPCLWWCWFWSLSWKSFLLVVLWRLPSSFIWALLQGCHVLLAGDRANRMEPFWPQAGFTSAPSSLWPCGQAQPVLHIAGGIVKRWDPQSQTPSPNLQTNRRSS